MMMQHPQLNNAVATECCNYSNLRMRKLVLLLSLLLISNIVVKVVESFTQQHQCPLTTTTLNSQQRKRLVPVRLQQQSSCHTCIRVEETNSMKSDPKTTLLRRSWIQQTVGILPVLLTTATIVTTQPIVVVAAIGGKPDCYTDCYKNCKILAPKDDTYCKESCIEYCNQDDREDGLSGSISSEKGEVGILGGSFGTGTVVKGQDRPPSFGTIPGLDFTSDTGKKMIGY